MTTRSARADRPTSTRPGWSRTTAWLTGTLITGWPAAWCSLAWPLIYRNWASRSGCWFPSTCLAFCADGGGSNGYRTRLWKTELTALAEQAGLEITVCHFPPGTSKWNKIEHRLFSHISMNWRGRPLTSHEVIVSLIASTRTTTGLTVQAALDQREYPQGIKIGDQAMRDLEKNYIKRHTFHGEWNHTPPPARSRSP
jgi:hypothetical protein